MKRYVLLLLISLAGCQNPSDKKLEEWKAAATRQSAKRVSDVIEQLHEDCDSTQRQIARYRVDSIRKVAPKPRTKK